MPLPNWKRSASCIALSIWSRKTRAKPPRVIDGLDGAAVAHLACHCVFRAESPLFSSLRLTDGPLYVHDLMNLREAPDTVVLSACDVGRNVSHASAEILGMATAFFALGTRSLIASTVPVPDSQLTSSLMVEFHRRLSQGSPPAQALSTATSLLGDSSDALLLRAGFRCFGV